MILLFSGPDFRCDSQTTSLCEELDALGQKYVLLDPFALQRHDVALVQHGSRQSLRYGRSTISPRVVYLSARWRTDSLIHFPQSLKYPGAFRSRIHQFLHDIRFAFESCTWYPGKHECIERADSKPRLFTEASKLGFIIPQFTIDSFVVPSRATKAIYRKNLGFPFIVTVNRKTGQEVALTTTNIVVDRSKKGIRTMSPWQWQEAIKANIHIRCCVVGDKVWAVSSDYLKGQNDFEDFRKVNEIDEVETVWSEINLDVGLRSKIINLNKILGLMISCPEFLIGKSGKPVLIDYNPCGDWQGFFSPAVNTEIAKSIASLISSGI